MMDAGNTPSSPPVPDAAQNPASTPAIKRRAPIACRRCRRMRTKCIRDKGHLPCQACLAAGLGPGDCVYPVRGQPDQDRGYRHPRVRQDKTVKKDAAKTLRDEAPIPRPPGQITPSKDSHLTDEWDRLPPLQEIIEAVNKFTRHYFQLGFIPKKAFPERLRTNHRSVSVFLVLGILSISARFTPSLVQRYGSGVKAAEMFMERASAVALRELYKDPDLERCQGFYLLSIAQQGSGLKSQSSVNMAIALRMATLMRLHQEKTYTLINPTKELVIKAESARRTFWMLHSQDNLHSGPESPISLVASDITALLPCNEEDFANGVEPRSRAALEATPPAIDDPRLITDQGRSLFATLVQSHSLWGAISRRAVSHGKSECPWEPDSEYAKMELRLRVWETGLPQVHRWSNELLKGYKADGKDLAYLNISMVTRLCNIVLRKAYLNEIISSASGKSDPALQPFWAKMSYELFNNVRMLYEQIDTQFKLRTNDDGKGVQMAAFCVYSCGFFACYLCKYPNICPDPAITSEGPAMIQRCVTILAESRDLWPLASRWLDGLEKFRDQKGAPACGIEGSMADGRDPIPHALHTAQLPAAVSPTQQCIRPVHPILPPPASSPPPQPQAHPLPNDRHNIQAQKPVTLQTIVPPPQTQTQMQQLPSPVPQAYTDSSIRISQQQSGHGTMAMLQQTQSSYQHNNHHNHHDPQNHPNQQSPPQYNHNILTTRPSTEGLSLLIEAFDTHQSDAFPHPCARSQSHTHSQADPHTQPQPYANTTQPTTIPHHDQISYPAHHPPPALPPTPALPSSDGYENELQYYLSDGVPIMSQGWVIGDLMYGY